MILAIDSATKSLGIALHDGRNILAECIWSGKGHHTVELAPEVGVMLMRVGASVSSLDAVAVAIGPGSYTGLRIGLAYAKGLSFACGIPIRAISTFDILAQVQPKQSSPMFTAIRAGRGRIAGSWYKWVRGKWKADGEAINTTWNEFDGSLEDEAYVCGEIDDEGHAILAMNRLVQVAQPALCIRRPSILAQLALKTRRSKNLPDPGSLAPIYLDKQDG